MVKEFIMPIHDEAMDWDEMFIFTIRKQKELIRCKDCKHSVDYYNDGECYCRNENYNGDSLIYISGGWKHYCGYAERKDE